jgi:hypothetical protein
MILNFLLFFTDQIAGTSTSTLTQVTPGRKNQTKYFQLLDSSGYVRKRLDRKIIRFRHYGKKEDPTNYYREQLMLFLPWRDEDDELLSIDPIEVAKENMDVINENSRPFYFNRDVDEDILQKLVDEADSAEDGHEMFESDVGDDNEIINDDDNFQDDDDVDEIGTSYTARVEKFLPPTMVNEEEYMKLMRSLNEKQRRFVLNTLHKLKTSSDPFHFFLSGGAGVGKSHGITAIVQSHLRLKYKTPTTNPEAMCVLVSAPTGKAAFNVFGMTIHCTFRLPPTQYGGKVCDLEASTINSLRNKLEKVELFIIDEVSMLSNRQLYDIDARLRQVYCTTQDFGNKSVLFVGDFNQLAPIGGSYVFKPPSHLPLGDCVGNYLWDKFHLFELVEIMRQRGDLEFCKALNNMAIGQMDEEDIKMMKSREINPSISTPLEAIHIFRTNAECDIYNSEIHELLNTESSVSLAHDMVQGINVFFIYFYNFVNVDLFFFSRAWL